jgi:hypothetical protein
LFVFVVSVALIAADLVVFAQNSNSSTGQDNTRGGQMTSNDNMGNMNTGGGRRRRRGRRTAATTNTGDTSGNMGGDASMQGNTGDMSGTANTGMGGTGRRRRRRRGGGAGAGMTTTTTTTTTTTAASEQTDLSGTYTGTLSCTGIPVSGEGTLAITGNQFTFTPTGGAGSANGRLSAVTTRGYTAVAMQFGESVAPPAGQTTSVPPVIISLRAKRAGDRLTLSGVPNTATRDCSFMSGGSGNTGGGRRRRRGRRSSMSTTDTTMTGTTDTGTAAGTTDTGTTTTTGGTGRRRRRGRRSGGNANTNANSGGMGNMNMNR